MTIRIGFRSIFRFCLKFCFVFEFGEDVACGLKFKFSFSRELPLMEDRLSNRFDVSRFDMSKSVVEKFGIPHCGQIQEMLLLSMTS